MEFALFPILPVPLYILVPALALLWVAYKLPRAGVVVGVIVFVLGLFVFAFPGTSDPFWKDMFEAIDRALGGYLMIYGGLWALVGGTRWTSKRRAVAVPV